MFTCDESLCMHTRNNIILPFVLSSEEFRRNCGTTGYHGHTTEKSYFNLDFPRLRIEGCSSVCKFYYLIYVWKWCVYMLPEIIFLRITCSVLLFPYKILYSLSCFLTFYTGFVFSTNFLSDYHLNHLCKYSIQGKRKNKDHGHSNNQWNEDSSEW